MASHNASGLPVGDGSDTIIKMVSLNQHWESASQGFVLWISILNEIALIHPHSNQQADRAEIL